MSQEKVNQLHGVLRPYLLRRTKAEVMKEIPSKVEVIVPVSMTPFQRRIYKMILTKSYTVLKSDKTTNIRRTSLRNVLMQLRKVCNHPYLLPDEEPDNDDQLEVHRRLVQASGKMQLLQAMLKELRSRGHRVLLFSQMTKMLDILEDFLEEEGYRFVRFDGDTARAERQEHIDAYNAPDSDIFIFLLSTRAGGVGTDHPSLHIGLNAWR